MNTKELQRPITDTYVSSANPSTNYGYSSELLISGTKTTLINVTMPVLPENRVILNAEFYTYYYYYVDSGYMTVAAYEYLYPWNIMYADWNFLNEHDNLGVSTTASATAVMQASASIDADSPGEAVFDLTELVRKWYNGTSTNYGIALKHIPAQSTNGSVILVSCDADNADDYLAYYQIDYQLIEEGVYGLRNVGNDGLWMDIQYNSTKAGARVQQSVFSSGNPVNSFSRSGLFKVNFHNGSVTLRTMLNNELVMMADLLASTVKTAKISPSNVSVAPDARFEIIPADEEDVYYIRYAGNWVVCANNTTASGSAGAPHSYLTIKTPEEAGDQGKWEFVKYTGAPQRDIIWTAVDSEILRGQTFDYEAVMYSTTLSLNGPVTYAVTNTDGTVTDKATIDSATGNLRALKPGTVQITATYDGTALVRRKNIEIVDSCFSDLLYNDAITADEIVQTSDGFYMLTEPLSRVLPRLGIYHLYSYIDGSEVMSVTTWYDDWYIFAISGDEKYTYGLLKMREQENDYSTVNGEAQSDGDMPGVTISFVEFDYSKLLDLINTHSGQDNYELYVAINQVTGPGIVTNDENLYDYFVNPQSDAPYLIAEEYIKFIVKTSCVNGGINAPDNYIEFSGDENLTDRLPDFIALNNANAGYNVYRANNTIIINDPEDLSMYEKYAILATHTGTVSFNSFAAEVVFHADALHSLAAGINQFYEAALRADIAIDIHAFEEESVPFYTNEYYDLESDIVQEQVLYHGGY